MNQDTVKRLFRSMQFDPNDDLAKVALLIIEEEEKKGHVQYAAQLKQIIDAKLRTKPIHKGKINQAGLSSIPGSKRFNTPLALEIERSQLRHHMILPHKVEFRFNQIEREYVARERLAHSGLKPKLKILLYGEPGNGKSMGAERIAWNIGLPFIKVRFEAIISSYLGESAINLREIFDSVAEQPCVILLDEFDFIGKSRLSGQDVAEMFRLVNMLLYLLDEYDGPGLLIATTNIHTTIDKALFRRFDDVIELPKPGIEEIEKLLRETLGAIVTSPDINWSDFAKTIDGFSAADVVKVAQNAAKYSIINSNGVVVPAHLSASIKEFKNI